MKMVIFTTHLLKYANQNFRTKIIIIKTRSAQRSAVTSKLSFDAESTESAIQAKFLEFVTCDLNKIILLENV